MVRYFLCLLLAISFGLYAGDTHQESEKKIPDSVPQITAFSLVEGETYGNPSDPGAQVVAGNYHQTGGTLNIRIVKMLSEKIDDSGDVITIKPSYSFVNDVMHVQGTARLGGRVAIKLDDGMLIKEGTTFTILTAENIEGRFEPMEPSQCILQPTLDYSSPNSVQIKFVAGRYGDLEYVDEEVKKVAVLLDKARNSKVWHEKFAQLFLSLDCAIKENVERQIKHVIGFPAVKKLKEYRFDVEL